MSMQGVTLSRTARIPISCVKSIIGKGYTAQRLGTYVCMNMFVFCRIDDPPAPLHTAQVVTETAPEDRGSASSSACCPWQLPAGTAPAFRQPPLRSHNVMRVPVTWLATVLAGALIVNSVATHRTTVANAGELVPQTETTERLFALDSLANERISLATYSGRVVLVHFFATWCEPCRAEMAALHRLAARFAEKPVTILAISVAEIDARVRRFFEAEPVNFPILLDRDRALSSAWRVATLPTTFVLDRALKPRFIVEGDFEWDRDESDQRLSALAIEQINGATYREFNKSKKEDSNVRPQT